MAAAKRLDCRIYRAACTGDGEARCKPFCSICSIARLHAVLASTSLHSLARHHSLG